MTAPTISFCTLGCKLNYAETSTISRKFTELGYVRVPFGHPASVVVVNSCTVTAQSDKKCRQAISKAVRSAPNAVVAVIGCFAQLRAEEISQIPGVDLVLGTRDKMDVVNRVHRMCFGSEEPPRTDGTAESFEPTYSLLDRTRSFLKIQDGCDYHCAYCTVALARGSSRNASVASVIASARDIVRSGIREIVLTGVNIGDFGRTTSETFLELLQALEGVEGVERIRISSIEPNLLTPEIIDFTAGSLVFLPHWHMPLQSGSNSVLARMGRRYQREVFEQRVQAILQRWPHAAVGVDVIAGFPGESDQDHEDTVSFLERLGLAYLHVFPFSERAGTRAVLMPGKIPHQVKEARARELIGLSARMRAGFYARFLGDTRPVLFEGRGGNRTVVGYTDNYIKVEVAGERSLINQIRNVRLHTLLPGGHVEGILTH